MTSRKEDQGQQSIKKIKAEAGENAKIEWLPCGLGIFDPTLGATFWNLTEGIIMDKLGKDALVN